jgi:putative phosphoesterase
MQKILILSGTHSYLDERLLPHIDWCTQIWHAGDWGNVSVADTLSSLKPVEGVYGNIDDATVRKMYPKINHFQCEDVLVGMTHIGGAPASYKPDALACFNKLVPDIFITGHSHILQVKRDLHRNRMLFINPGAAGQHGFHQVQTAVRLKVEGKRIFEVEIVEMPRFGKEI